MGLFSRFCETQARASQINAGSPSPRHQIARRLNDACVSRGWRVTRMGAVAMRLSDLQLTPARVGLFCSCCFCSARSSFELSLRPNTVRFARPALPRTRSEAPRLRVSGVSEDRCSNKMTCRTAPRGHAEHYLTVACTVITDVPEAVGPCPVALMAKVSLPLYFAFALYSYVVALSFFNLPCVGF